MDSQSLREVIDVQWEAARRDFAYPQVPPVRVEDEGLLCRVERESGQVTLAAPFFGFLEEGGVDPSLAVNEVISHELTHYTLYPGSVLQVLRLQREGLKVAGEQKVSELRRLFNEVQANSYMALVKRHEGTVPVQRLIAARGEELMLQAILQDVWREDLGVKVKGEIADAVRSVRDVQYLDRNSELINFRRFVERLKDVDMDKAKSGGGLGGLVEKVKGWLGKGSCAPEKHSQWTEDLAMFSEAQVREGLAQFAQECDDPAEFERVVGSLLEGKSPGGGVGTARGGLRECPDIYSVLARRFSVPIHPKRLERGSGLYPHSHESFSVGDPLTDLDPFSAPGILPGIVKKWKRAQGQGFASDTRVPDCLVMIDNSGSMPDPGSGVSVPVLAATVIADAYLDRGALVGAYTFGGVDKTLDFCADRKRIGEFLRLYSGGGTTFSDSHAKRMVQEREECDVAIVSDMGIHNLEVFVQSLLSLPQTHRVHVIDTAGSRYESFKRRFESNDNIGVMRVLEQEDLHNLSMGELGRYLG